MELSDLLLTLAVLVGFGLIGWLMERLRRGSGDGSGGSESGGEGADGGGDGD